MAEVILKNIKKVYPHQEPAKKKKGSEEKKTNLQITDEGVLAVQEFSLNIADKEFIVLVGPSGCGKSTTLRMVAGLEEISGGELYIDGKLMNDVAPKDRDIAMVFQNYALYPHMTVRENMAFPLKLKKYPKEEIRKRVDQAAEVLGITEYLDRKPKALSGGQRQRVAIGRAIVREPKVLLMDEPLSNLDAKLRIEMREAIREVQKKIGITTVYVTHDQEEALAISDRIAVMNKGDIQQIETPERIYSRPYNTFVADFIGHSNRFTGTVMGQTGDTTTIRMQTGLVIDVKGVKPLQKGTEILIYIRPEEFIFTDGQHGMKATVTVKRFLGKYIHYVVDCGTGAHIEVTADTSSAEKIHEPGETIYLSVNTRRINLFDAQKETTLLQGVESHV